MTKTEKELVIELLENIDRKYYKIIFSYLSQMAEYCDNNQQSTNK